MTYGLGSDSQNLPGFVALTSGGGSPGAGSGNWASGFLPSVYQGVPFRNSGDPVLHLSNVAGIDAEDQRATLDAIRDLNRQNYIRAGDIEIASRIASYELAFRMQSAAPELLDFSKEPPGILEMVWWQHRADSAFRCQLPAGAAYDRTWSEIRPVDARYLGRPFGFEQETKEELRNHGSTHRRFAQRLEAERTFG